MKYNWRIDTEEVKRLYSQGLSCEKIGKMLGASRQAIWEKLKNHKVETRSKIVLPYIMYDGIKFTPDDDGYYRKTSRTKNVFLHRYKWEKEVGPIPAGCEVHHEDENKQNNDLDNLRCITKSEHSSIHGNHRANRGELGNFIGSRWKR